MRSKLGSIILAFAMTGAVGCAHHYARVYDPYYGDYHVWNAQENVYYDQWVTETHRPHRDFHSLPPDEQKQYWDWRHHHGDHGHDHDHDHDQH